MHLHAAKQNASCPMFGIHQEIVLAKLRPGQEVEMELHAIKGLGKDHAKWSPVGMFCPSRI